MEILVLGSSVYKVLSEDVWRSVCNIFKSCVSVLAVVVDSPPLTSPLTVVIPTISTVLGLTVASGEFTAVTLAYVGRLDNAGASKH